MKIINYSGIYTFQFLEVIFDATGKKLDIIRASSSFIIFDTFLLKIQRIKTKKNQLLKKKMFSIKEKG